MRVWLSVCSRDVPIIRKLDQWGADTVYSYVRRYVYTVDAVFLNELSSCHRGEESLGISFYRFSQY